MATQAEKQAALKGKANDLRKALAQIDKLTGAAFTVTKRAEIAAFFAVSIQTVDNWTQRGMPGGRGHWDLHKIVCWLRSEGPWRPLGGNHGTVEDLVEDGPESEWSEEYRKWKAHSAKVAYEKEIKRLVSVDEATSVWFDTVLPEVREFAERVIKAHGNGTAEDWEDTCNRIDDAIQSHFDRIEQQQAPNGNGDERPDTEATDAGNRPEVLGSDAPPLATGPADAPDGVGGEENQAADGTVCGASVPA